MQNVRQYIFNNWPNTFRDPKHARGKYTMPKPFVSPSSSGAYQNFFYWDTYFANLGLMVDGYLEQVENNLDNMAYFIDELGYMPNANVILDRSQPPLFCRAVYDFYMLNKDTEILKKYLPFILKEYEFWQTQRMTPYGVNNFSTNGSEDDLMMHYDVLYDRVCAVGNTKEERLKIGKDIMIIAESGLDFNMRFKTERSKIDASSFLHLDLNCFLYGLEKNIAKILTILGEDGSKFEGYAQKRKDLINQYFYDEQQKIYLDYNFVDGKFSDIVSIISLYPYAFGISDDIDGLKKVLSGLEFEYGVSTAPYREDTIFYQWDYPCMWAPTLYFALIALERLGLHEDWKRIAEKYLRNIENNFQKTGQLWEKYDAVNGGIGQCTEYDTPEMMGWTAGVYVYCCEKLKNA